MKLTLLNKILFCCLFLILATNLFAQDPVVLPGGPRRPPRPYDTAPSSNTPNSTNPNNRGQKSDTTLSNVERRDYSDDSLQVEVYHFSAVKPAKFDTSIRDYTTRFPIPGTHLFIGNDGSATRSYLFAPAARIGWDPGFHSHDVYKWKVENLRFYNTPKPFTELGYMLGTEQEQMIDVLHTQNVKPHWNVSFQYRLLSSPGIFRNQKNNHTNYQFASWYQSPGKRYNNYFAIIGNKIQAGENGGIRTDKDYLNDPTYSRRFTVPTNIGGEPSYGSSLFYTNLITGRRDKEFTFLMRQQYDLGRKDSLVTDSTVIPLFYPRLRFEHTLRYAKYNYRFQDVASGGDVNNFPDSSYYDSLYGIHFSPGDPVNPGDSVFIQDSWREWSTDFSVYQFPDANNLQQFVKLGAELQLLKGLLRTDRASLYNIIAHGEYRNRTKNQKWDMVATGRLYTAGNNIGDYHAYVSLQRLLSEKLGSLQVGFENINRSPSFIYDQRSSFYFDAPKDFSNENTLHFFGRYFIPKLQLQLGGDYYFVTNYLYLNDYKSLQQENAVFNLLRVSAFKTFRLSRRWNLHSEVYVQPKAGGAAINLPAVYTRNRIAYEGLVFRNLNLSTGVEIRYHTPYKADNYSPVLGQFFYQDTLTINNYPDIHAFLHMRIKSFKTFVRLENLNALSAKIPIAFENNNIAAPNYPSPGLVIRFGFYWSFVN